MTNDFTSCLCKSEFLEQSMSGDTHALELDEETAVVEGDLV